MRSSTKSLTGGRVRLVALSALALVLVPAAIAWACNPQAHMKCGGAQGCQVAPGGSLNVSGTYFQTNADLTLSSDSGAFAPVSMTTNSGGAFSSTIQAPTEPGSYTLLAKRSDGAGRSGLPARLSFEVVASSSAAPSPTAGPPANATPTPQAQQGPSFNEPSVTRSPAQQQQQRPSSDGREQGTSTPGQSPAARTPASGGSDGTAVTEDAGREVFAGSVAPTGGSSTPSFGSPSAAPTSGSQAESATGPSGRSSGTPSEQAAGGDVWSGFGSGSTGSLMPSTGDAAVSDGGTGSGFGWGIGLLSLGLLALVSGVAVAEVRRRRVLAGS